MIRVPIPHMEARGEISRGRGRRYPLAPGEAPPFPVFGAALIDATIDHFNVETSARWAPKGGSTYCNVYAYDVVRAVQGGDTCLPRTWWYDRVLREYARTGYLPTPVYGRTIREMSANALTDWLREYGPALGWRLAQGTRELQDAACDGFAAVICCARTDPKRSGHITVVVPETPDFRYDATEGVPVQSQAGSSNCARFTTSIAGKSRGRWWESSRFRDFVFAHQTRRW